MRSLANDIREGCKISPYKIKERLFDGHGGACEMGAAMIGAGCYDKNGRFLNHSTCYQNWPAQLEMGIVDRAVSNNNFTDLTREEIADIVEQEEWKLLGIPTRAMKEELARAPVAQEAVSTMLLPAWVAYWTTRFGVKS